MIAMIVINNNDYIDNACNNDYNNNDNSAI